MVECYKCNNSEIEKGIFFTYDEIEKIEEEIKSYDSENIDIFVANMIDKFGTSSTKCTYCGHIENEDEEYYG